MHFGSQSAPVVFQGNVLQVNLDNPVTKEYYVKADDKCRGIFADFHAAYYFAALELEDTDCLDALQTKAHAKLRAATRERY